MLILPARLVRPQPEPNAQIDWDHPLSRGLVFSLNPAVGLRYKGGISYVRPQVAVPGGVAQFQYTPLTVPGLNGRSMSNWTFAWVANFASLGGLNANVFTIGGRLTVFLRYTSGGDYNVYWTNSSSASWEFRASYIPAFGVRHSYAFTRANNAGAHYVNGDTWLTGGGLSVNADLNSDTVSFNSDSISRLTRFDFWDRALSPSEIKDWHERPWSNYKKPRRSWVPVSAPTTTPRLLTVRREVVRQPQGVAAPALSSAFPRPAMLWSGLTGFDAVGKRKSNPYNFKPTKHGVASTFSYNATQTGIVTGLGVTYLLWGVFPGSTMVDSALYHGEPVVYAYRALIVRMHGDHTGANAGTVSVYARNNSVSGFDNYNSAIPADNQPHVYIVTVDNGNYSTLYVDGKPATKGWNAQPLDSQWYWTPNQIQGYGGTDGGVLLLAAWSSLLTPEQISLVSRNPWRLYEPKRMNIPIGSYPLGPYLSNATYINLTSSGFQPRVTLTMPG